MKASGIIRTPDQRLRVFVSSTLRELADERTAVREAITQLRLAPVMFELGARPHQAITLYRAYLEQSHIFIGIYWQSYGYVAPGMEVSGLEDEYSLAREKPKLIYIKKPAPECEAGLTQLLNRIKTDDMVSYKFFSSADELRQLVENDLALLLTERFEVSEMKLGDAKRLPDFINDNLPAQVTSFIGRENEIATVMNLLADPQIRLLTLTGPGGTGKTRLGLQVATRIRDQYKDGVFLVSLAEARNTELVVSKIGEVLGVREGGSQTLVESIKGYLREKQCLLLLDNFEQILEAGPLVIELLISAPKLKIMVTSRALLNLQGEHEFQVPTLELPGTEASNTAEQLANCESVRMFIDRARATNPQFVLDEHNALVVAEICRRLDGLPLAIELAAARIKILAPEKLLSLLNSRLKLLTGGGRDLPERQQTLRNTLEWSVQLLNQGDQKLFNRLGIFMGGFTLEGAEEVCHLENEHGTDIFRGIETLLNSSLLRLDNNPESEPRFRMLETIREYALEKLTENGELAEVEHRHAQFFIDKMNNVSQMLSTREAERGLAWVDVEHDNLRAALAYCFMDATLLPLAPWLVISLNWAWYRRGFLSEGRAWANRLLHSSIIQESTIAHCYALWSSGAMAMWQGDLNDAQALLVDAVSMSKSIESPHAVAVTSLFLGTAFVNRGEDKKALQYLQEALELFEQLNMPWYQAITLVHMGNASLGLGNYSDAQVHLDQALPISQQIGENWLRSFLLNNYGEIARTAGDYQKAQIYYEESESLLRSMGDKGDLARLIHNLGCVARHTGDLSEAESKVNESLAMFVALGNQRGVAECLASFSALWFDRGHAFSAAKLLGAAQGLLDATGATWWPADREEVDKNLENLHQCLQEEQFEIAWRSGFNMSLEQAISFVKSNGQ